MKLRYATKRITKTHVRNMSGVHPMFGPGEYKSLEIQTVLQFMDSKGKWREVPMSDEIIEVEIEV